ncbi:MAG: lipopolysaccharide biosynthesis protein [Clostridia bacterium]|nr:lipopolysaccharide biosynthesis protein [Clostridia bacterium]
MSVSDSAIIKATKWSFLSQILSKLAAPVSSMILARILAPSVYGIVASVNMVISFCELFSDAGFNKYIVQHEAKDEDDLKKIINIAFITNFVLTMLIWGVICIFATPIASLVGCPGKETAVMVACVMLPLHGFMSIQDARFRRDMDFKMLFFFRMVTLIVPFAVTIPIALATRSYWALIIGNIASSAIYVIAMEIKLKWRPMLYFSFSKLREMFSFSMWSMLEAILVWVINWGDVFIVTRLLSQGELGIYKTSMNMVGQIIGIISAAIVPVHLSALSRAQNDSEKFKELFYKFSTVTGIILIPLGAGMLVYKDLLCYVTLGSQWMSGATLMGMWGLISAVAILFNSFGTNALIAKGKPKISVIVQLLQIVVIIPTVYFSARTSFECLSYTRALIRVFGMVAFSVVLRKMFSISAFTTLRKLLPVLISTIGMAIVGVLFVYFANSVILEFVGVFVCIIVYFAILMVFPSVRKQTIPQMKALLFKRK